MDVKKLIHDRLFACLDARENFNACYDINIKIQGAGWFDAQAACRQSR